METIIGIDLGTSTSEVSVFEDGKPRVLPNHVGELITPSVICHLANGEILIGRDAKDQYLLKPQDTVMEVKRAMGSTNQIPVAGKLYTPEALSAELLNYLKECAEKALGKPINRAVITVPAYFDDCQRRKTVEAGKLAGLEVERLINEPTAAALAYGIQHIDNEGHVLVYDLGGGTLDVTLLEMFDGVLEVKASSGNNHLGGKDFDEELMTYFLKNLEEKYHIALEDDIYAMSKLKEEAEKCKIALSTQVSYEVDLPFLAKKDQEIIGLQLVVTREQFEAMIRPYLETTGQSIERVLKDSQLEQQDIDLVLLVGGSTRIPAVKAYVQEQLDKEPQSLVDPDLAVAMGAAIQGAMLSGILSQETDLMMTDVCPYSLGIEVVQQIGSMWLPDCYSIILPRNVTIPVTKSQIYYTCEDGQTQVEINIFQGESKKASDNRHLGAFTLSPIPPAPAGTEAVKVVFSYDVNGILDVEAYVQSTGEKASIQIHTTGVKGPKEINIAKAFKRTIKKAEAYLEDGGEKEEMKALLDELLTAIDKADEGWAEEVEERILELLYED